MLQKQNQRSGDLAEEIESLNKALDHQKLILQVSVKEEFHSVKKLGDMLSKLE